MSNTDPQEAARKFRRYPAGVRRIVNKLFPAHNTHELDRLWAAKMIRSYATRCVKWERQSWRWPGLEKDTNPLIQ